MGPRATVEVVEVLLFRIRFALRSCRCKPGGFPTHRPAPPLLFERSESLIVVLARERARAPLSRRRERTDVASLEKRVGVKAVHRVHGGGAGLRWAAAAEGLGARLRAGGCLRRLCGRWRAPSPVCGPLGASVGRDQGGPGVQRPVTPGQLAHDPSADLAQAMKVR